MKHVLNILIVLMAFGAYGQNWRDTLDMARSAYKKANYGKALEYYESAQKGAPENVDLSDEMAQSAYKARDFERAEKIYQQSGNSKKTDQEKARNNHNLGNSRMKQKKYQDAIEAYKESLRKNPNDDETRYNLSEAIRQLKNQQGKGGGQGNGGGGGDKDPQNNGDEEGEGDNEAQNSPGNSNAQNGNQPNKQNGPKNGQPQGSNEGTLQNKSVERMLDQLMRAEAETKRKLGGNKGDRYSPKSGKDW